MENPANAPQFIGTIFLLIGVIMLISGLWAHKIIPPLNRPSKTYQTVGVICIVVGLLLIIGAKSGYLLP